ncbi:hypothetical protein LIER_40710 [Lithospermum erythrorhizon]|uniref:RNase H type-1 domain-containing protein n=1 Tax=Lithospermum erythrorhizon TaxID=34254 RepID=A0AAV3R1Q1_LITER
MKDVPRERNREVDRLFQVAMARYETLLEATVVDWVEKEAFWTKEVMNNDVLEEAESEVYLAGRGIVPEIVPGSAAQMCDTGGRIDGARRGARRHVRKPHQCESLYAEDPMLGSIMALNSYG